MKLLRREIMKIYFCAPVRGKDGDSVSHDDKWRNIHKAREIAGTIRHWFPNQTFYIPHDKESEWEESELLSDAILEICVGEVIDSDLLIVYAVDGISGGMALEISKAEEFCIPIIYLYEWTVEIHESQQIRISRCLAEMEYEQLPVQM